MDKVLHKHQENLIKRCRTCNKPLGSRRYPKTHFRDIVLKYYGEDFCNDDPFVHPTHVCDPHRQVLKKMKKADDDGTKYSTNMILHTFKAHDDQCTICQIPCDHTYSSSDSSCKKRRKSAAGPGRGKFFSTCVTSVSSSVQEPNVPVNVETPEEEIVSKLLILTHEQRKNCLEKILNSISLNEMIYLANKLGEKQSTSLFHEALAISDSYKTLSLLAGYSLSHFLDNSNAVVRSFLEGCSKHSKDTRPDKKKNYLIGLSLEMVYKLRYPSCIAPLSFMRNLAAYVGHDKAKIMKINGVSAPGGSYTTVTNWVKSLSALPPTCPDGDLINVFDNDQVVGKTWGVRPENKVKSSVITNRAWIQADPTGSLQSDEDLSPGKWLGAEKMEDVHQAARKMRLNNKEDPAFSQLNYDHRQQLTYFLQVAITEVLEERVLEPHSDGIWKDIIDIAVETARVESIYQKCPICHSLVLRTKRNCTNPTCKVNLKQARGQVATMASTGSLDSISEPMITVEEGSANASTESLKEERYPHIEHHHPHTPPEIIVADPVFVNPNSYESLRTVLRKIGSDAGIYRYGGKKRYWTVVCCDGLPYHLCMKLIQQTFTCNECKQSVFGTENMHKHVKVTCPGAMVYREFDWVLLKIGGGHYEANMLKGFMELNWQPFMSDLCSLLSFRSPLAQQSAKRCDDHHKTWAIMLTFHLGALKELVVVYIRTCDAENEQPTPSGFIDFAHRRRHIPNFAYMYDQVCKYSQAIVNFRMGTRRNNAKLINSAKHIFKDIFHGRNHPIYALIEINDTLINHLAPAPVKEFLDRHSSISKSGDHSKGQDADYILEETNQQTKSWIPRGVPQDENWLQVCRNLPHLKIISSKIGEITGVTTTSEQGYRTLDVDAGVHAWRCRLRETGYLHGESLHHTTITGEPLSGQLSSFRTLADGKRANHISSLFDPDVVEDTKPVFVTEKEEQEAMAIENKTVPEIKKRICEVIEVIDSEDDRTYFQSKYDRVKGKRKAELVKLYYEIQNHHIQQAGVVAPNQHDQ